MNIRDKILAQRGQVLYGSNLDAKEEVLGLALDSGLEWANLSGNAHFDHKNRSKRKLEKECKRFIYANTKFPPKPVGFIGGIFWSWVIGGIVRWVVTKIIEALFND